MKKESLLRILSVSAIMGLASAAGAQNALLNPSFEQLCTPASNWTKFGNVENINFYTVSGTRSIKMFGTFCGAGPCYSGISQVYPAAPGSNWRGSAFVQNPCWDRFRDAEGAGGGTEGLVTIDFLDSVGDVIPGSVASPSQEEPTIAGGGANCTPANCDPPNSCEPLPVLLQTPYGTAPAGTVSVRITLLVKQTQFIGGAAWWDDAVLEEQSSPGVNVLANPSFEQFPVNCNGSAYVGWVNFGNGGEFGLARTGEKSARLFGGYNGNPAYSGWFQNVATTPGKRWLAKGWARSLDTDALANGNDVRVGIEFFDQFGTNLIGTVAASSPVPTPGDNTYRFYSSGFFTAPIGASFARCLIIQRQDNFAGGITLWDDMEFYSTDCVADYDDGSGQIRPDGGVGIEDLLAYLGVYDSGSVLADVDDGTGTGIQDGGVGIEDLLYYLVRYDAGC